MYVAGSYVASYIDASRIKRHHTYLSFYYDNYGWTTANSTAKYTYADKAFSAGSIKSNRVRTLRRFRLSVF